MKSRAFRASPPSARSERKLLASPARAGWDGARRSAAEERSAARRVDDASGRLAILAGAVSSTDDEDPETTIVRLVGWTRRAREGR
jgi:hypothetical protein